MSENNLPVCPRCGHYIPTNHSPGEYPGALSRRDNKTEICSPCGVLEAMEDLENNTYTGLPYWVEE